MFTTDGRIASLDLTVLDDRGYFPAYNIAPIVLTETLQEHPGIADVFAEITPLLTDEVMIELNGRVDVGGEDPAEVALDWMVSEGLVSRGRAGPRRPGCGRVATVDEKATLQRYLVLRREDLVAKLDGLGEYDVRRPLTPTGTNLLGLVKHVAYVQLGYLGDVFGRSAGRPYPWDGGEDDDDMWARPDERRDDVVELYRFSAAHADATVAALPLDAVGEVPWWPPERRHPTLHTVLVHLAVEVARHAGHADVLRELLDGSVGMSPATTNLPERTAGQWSAFRDRVEAAAREAAGPAGAPGRDG
ncbi:DUF664 domain-containing protein [Geodermatophilus sp. SYSU D00758]